MERKIVFLVYQGFQVLDLAGPIAAFESANRLAGGQVYRLQTVSLDGGAVVSSCGLPVVTERLGDGPYGCYDTLVVVGGFEYKPSENIDELAGAVLRVSSQIRRTASVCTGAFILATAGLLDSRRGTTHWRHAARLQREFPRVKVLADKIFVNDGGIWSSAGTSAGIDLALALVQEDCGAEISRAVARDMVVYHQRQGGQSQFSTLLEAPPDSDRIRAALSYVSEHLTEDLSVGRLAEIACLSPRQFSRSFVRKVGETPAKAVERMRVEAAQRHIEASWEPIEAIARQVGFSDPERMRRAFVRLFGHPPQGLRRAARARRTGGSPAEPAHLEPSPGDA